eukprot:CAMPEP_0115007038 /NCGR_PEP_ID=MMETSP0216-20121206/20899_1 /TAXON_ID=223996 /ORGANISM="Protocruzia adherens, Strain Boccale" /LENGTH=171 /DNA_ID=CAMNT_0002373819 /DNA_START=100 /DNA_END=615 /DNA_ORIENTATION=+
MATGDPVAEVYDPYILEDEFDGPRMVLTYDLENLLAQTTSEEPYGNGEKTSAGNIETDHSSQPGSSQRQNSTSNHSIKKQPQHSVNESRGSILPEVNGSSLYGPIADSRRRPPQSRIERYNLNNEEMEVYRKFLKIAASFDDNTLRDLVEDFIKDVKDVRNLSILPINSIG